MLRNSRIGTCPKGLLSGFRPPNSLEKDQGHDISKDEVLVTATP